MFLSVLCAGAAHSADLFWSPTSFEDGTPAMMYLTNETDHSCPAMWYRAHAVNKKTHAVNRDSLCWTIDPSGVDILANRTTGATQILSPVGFVKGSQDGSPSLFDKFIRQHTRSLIERQQQIQATIDEEIQPRAPMTQPEKNMYEYTHGHPYVDNRTPEQIKKAELQDEKDTAARAERNKQEQAREEKKANDHNSALNGSAPVTPPIPAWIRFLGGHY